MPLKRKRLEERTFYSKSPFPFHSTILELDNFSRVLEVMSICRLAQRLKLRCRRSTNRRKTRRFIAHEVMILGRDNLLYCK